MPYHLPPPITSNSYQVLTKGFKKIKHRIPLFCLVIHTIMTSVFFEPTVMSHYPTNQSDIILQLTFDTITHVTYTPTTYRHIFWGYYPILCIFCIIWEYYHYYFTEHFKYPDLSKRYLIFFSVLSSLFSVTAFILATLFYNQGIPISIIFPYKRSHVKVAYYVYMGLLFVFTYVEEHAKLFCNHHKHSGHSIMIPRQASFKFTPHAQITPHTQTNQSDQGNQGNHSNHSNHSDQGNS